MEIPKHVGRSMPTISKEKIGKGCRIGFAESNAK
jgi:hypothetical protein